MLTRHPLLLIWLLGILLVLLALAIAMEPGTAHTIASDGAQLVAF
jgi:hypothetical protein